jgi:chromosome segregation ATPase
MTDSTKQQIEELESYLAELKGQEQEFDHQLRRYADADVRGSAGPQKLGEELESVKRNLADSRKERERVEAKLAELKDTRGPA